jgi:WD repeat and SOF domain-containing protein 1
MDLDYSPTGEEIVTGAYDRTMRIFGVKDGHSRDIYHTKRMQRIFCIKYSMDSKYVFTGSDDGNIRVWKSNASEKMGVKTPREIAHLNYADKIKERYGHLPEIKRISRHRYLPKAIDNARKKKHVMVQSAKRKEENRRKHSKPGAVPHVSEKKKHIVGVQE